MNAPNSNDLMSLPAGLRVLYVDDDDVVLAMVKMMMAKLGVQVDCVGSAGELFAAIAASPAPYDAVVADHHLPPDFGLDALARLREINPTMPLVLMTSHKDASLEGEAAALGILEVVEKSPSVDGLCRALRRELGRNGLLGRDSSC